MKTCCIFNYASSYREAIYKLMDKELACDFFFGDNAFTSLKKMDYSVLSGFKKELKTKKIFSKLHYIKGACSLVFKDYDCFILTGNLYCLSNWLILFFAWLLGKKVFLWTHGWYGKESKIQIIIKKLFYSFATKVLLYGDYAKELMIKNGIKASKLVCVYNSLDYDKQKIFRENLKFTDIYRDHFDNNYFNLLYVGRVQKVKKIEQVIDAMRILHNRGVFCNFTIVGADVDGCDLMCDVKRLDLQKNVWFYGECFDEVKLSELFYNADLLVSPGNVGLTAIHSLSYGLPIITHNDFPNQMPEFGAIENEYVGGFFERDNINDFADVIQQKIEFYLAIKKDEIRNKAFSVIDKKYNPYYQLEVIKSVVK